MTITRKSLADVIDEIDDQIADLQASKRDTFQSYREQLSALMGKDEVKVEIEATKAAIKRRRAIREKGEEVIEHKDALADEIFEEITAARAPRATRVSARAVPHDADGVVLDDEEISPKAPAYKALEAVTSAEEINQNTAETPNEAAHTSHVGAARQAEEEVRASSATHPGASGNGDDGILEGQEATGARTAGATPATGSNSEPQHTAAQTGGPSSAPTSVAGPEAVESPAANFPADAERPRPTQVAHVGIGGEAEPPAGAPGRSGDIEPPAHDPAPVDHSKPNPWCLDPEECGLSSWEYFCMRCQRVKAEREAVSAVQ